MWSLYTIFECYQAYCLKYDYRYVINNQDNGPMSQVLTEYDKKKLSFIHVMLVQGNVIEAVKHAEGGSKAFQKYFLDGMTQPENIEFVRNELTTPVKDGGYGLSHEDANKMLYIVQWAVDTKLLKAVKNFITKYNKGKLPAKPEALDLWEDFIQENSYFGKLMTKVFVIKKEIDTMEKEARAQTERLMAEEDSKDLFGGINLSALDALNSIPDFDTSKPTSDGFDFDDLLDSLPNFG